MNLLAEMDDRTRIQTTCHKIINNNIALISLKSANL